jgi:hypothetical protein
MVHYKGAGTRVLLRYYTRDSGGRVILARTEAAAVLSFKERLSEAQNIPRPLDFLRIELVAPSPSAVLRANKIRKLRLAENFLFAITWEIERVGGDLPPELSLCPACAGLVGNDNHDCYQGIVLTGCGMEEFFDRYSAAWCRLNPHPFKEESLWSEQTIVCDSGAVAAEEDEPIWVAGIDVGTDCAGVGLVLQEPGSCLSGLTNQALFYYRLLEVLDIGPLEEVVRAAQAEQKQRQLEDDLKFKAKKNLELETTREKLRALFSFDR